MPARLLRGARIAAALFTSAPLFALPLIAGGDPPPPPFVIGSLNGQVLVYWLPVAGASGYAIHWDLGPLDGASPVVHAAAPPYVIPSLPGGATAHVAIASVGAGGAEGPLSAAQTAAVAPGGAEKFFPAWADAPAQQVLVQSYDPGLSSAQNGALLEARMEGLTAGQELRVGAGTWTVNALLDLRLAGTAAKPIRIVAQAGAKPVLTRGDTQQNTVNVGAGGPARYLLLRGFEITGGDIALRIGDARDVWIDLCHVHDCAQGAITANTAPVDRLHVTRSEIHGTGGYGEGIYLGGNDGSEIASRCVIAQNHVHDTGGSQGDGVEVKQGSWGNLIAENFVHGTRYPCVLVGGTGGKPRNVIERNVLVGSDDAVLQVQGEARVRNNVIANGNVGFLSFDHQGQVRDLAFVHNTIVNQGTAARMNDWNARPGMVFANNAAYSLWSDAILFQGGSSGVAIGGNVAYGPVSGASSGYVPGKGLEDFVAVTWDGALLNVTPALGGALDGAGGLAWMDWLDVLGNLRMPGLEAGAVDAP
jgi:hypothetical protein